MARKKRVEAADAARPTYSQLTSFLSLAKWRKQAAVEADLGISQSQVSRDLSALEALLGDTVLFDRAGRKITSAGKKLEDYAVGVLGGWQRLRSHVTELADESGRLLLEVDADCATGAALPLVASLRTSAPGLKIQVAAHPAARAAEALRKGEADAALLPDGASKSGLSFRSLLKAEVWVAVPKGHALARSARIAPRMLRDCTLLLPPEGSQLRSCVERALGRTLHRRTSICEMATGRESVLSAVATGLGHAPVFVFPQAADPLLGAAPADIALRPTTKAFGTAQYNLAIRRGQQPGGPLGLMIKELLGIARRS
jgi:LysR family transcriptional regulator, hydrogen peroxide-inducible genes activator